MNRQQVSWLIVRAFGLYLLVQAFMVVPDLLGGLYAARAYSNFVSSLSSESEYLSGFRKATSVYRSALFAPTLKILLFSVMGMYLLRGGGFLVRLLDRAPDPPTEVGDEGDAQQIVGRERRERVSHHDSSGDA
jgi:hypothetical protein